MPLEELNNLVKIGKIKPEPVSLSEVERLLNMSRVRLSDSSFLQMSQEGRFTSVYNALHSAALAALRWHGFRSENRYIVFQSLAHTVNWEPKFWRVIDSAHQKRNLAEYEGFLEVEDSTILELCALAEKLIDDVDRLLNRCPEG
jgi:hypothetical protein